MRQWRNSGIKSTPAFITTALFFCAMLSALPGCDSPGKLGEPARLGPPGMVSHSGEPRLWLLVKQTESWRYTYQTLYHFELLGHDTRTAQRVWGKHLLTVSHGDGGYNATARILGQDGAHVWLFLHNQPVAVSSADGAVIADRARLEAANPELKGLFPSELPFYTHDGGLVITTADARRFRVNAPDFKARPYTPASDDAFRRLSFMSTQWNGGYQTKDFLVRQGMLWGRWIGIHTEKEAAETGKDEFGSRLKDPSGGSDEGALARRTLWTARIGKTRRFSEGSHDRLFDVTRLPGTAEYLQGGFLARAGIRQPLLLTAPDSALILHRTRVDAEGRLVLTRVDNQFREHWKAVLPYTDLTHRWEWPDRLLLMGKLEIGKPGASKQRESVVAINLQDGRMQVSP
jgi:hypothetical protein